MRMVNVIVNSNVKVILNLNKCRNKKLTDIWNKSPTEKQLKYDS